MIATPIGLRLREARRRKGLTQGELAHKLGLTSHAAICDIERGRRGKRVNVPMMVKACEILDITFDWLFLGKEKTKK